MEKVNPGAAEQELNTQPVMLAAIREAARKLEAVRLQQTEPVAVIGMACRFPQAPTLDAFWKLLTDGRDAVTPVAPERWDADAYQARTAREHGKLAFNGGAFVADVDRFDSRFFEITHREARSLDPQQRLLLEIAWETLEHAGVLPHSVAASRCGVFTGICSSDYLLRLMQCDPKSIDPYFSTGNAHGTAAGRVSYFMKWQGPCLAIDTACSSSLVAVHVALQSLRNDECELALAMGVNLMLSPQVGISLSQAGMLSPTGASRAFAAGADGFVRGEGCGAVLLKRLSHAQRDGDRVFAILRGSAVNQDGRSNGLTAPNGAAQQDVIRSALRRAGVEPQDVDYVEAHGTGTELGDPVEMDALVSVFAPRRQPLRVGSVKTNIGHLEGAAGIAGVIKTCLALHHQQLPKHLHFDRPSEHIAWQSGFEVPAEGLPWPSRQDRVRRAGVSSFGFGGTNAHLVVEEAPAAGVCPGQSGFPARCGWLKLSARNMPALREQARRYADALQSGPLAQAEVAEILYAANVGRSDFNCRAAICGADREQLLRGLERLAQASASVQAGLLVGDSHAPPEVVWSFPELPAVSFEHGVRALSEAFPVFASSWQELQLHLPTPCPLRLFGCALQLALGALWKSFGLHPQIVAGHGLGHVAAAVAAGVLTSAEGLEIATLVAQSAGPEHASLQTLLDALPIRKAQCFMHGATRWGGAADVHDASYWLQCVQGGEERRGGGGPGGRGATLPDVSVQDGPPASPRGGCVLIVGDVGVGDDAVSGIWSALMQLYVAGTDVDWRRVLGHGRRTVSLPTYSFQRQRCWHHESPRVHATAAEPHRAAAQASTLLGKRLDLASPSIIFETDLRHVPQLADHRLRGRSIFPLAGFLELAMAAGAEISGRPLAVEGMRIIRPLSWDVTTESRIQLIVDRSDPADASAVVYRCTMAFHSNAGWQRHAECRLTEHRVLPAHMAVDIPGSTEALLPGSSSVSHESHYRNCEAAGFTYRGCFRSLRHLTLAGRQGWGDVALPPADGGPGALNYVLHPAILDGCLQSLVALLLDEGGLWLPVAVDRFVVRGASADCRQDRTETSPLVDEPPGPAVGGYQFSVHLQADDHPELRRADFTIWNARRECIAFIEGLALQRTAGNDGIAGSRGAVASGGGATREARSDIGDVATASAASGGPSSRFSTTLAVSEFVCNRVAMILECDRAEINPDMSLESLGLDSMMILELLDVLEQHLGINVPLQRFANGITLKEIAEYGFTAGVDKTVAAQREPGDFAGQSATEHVEGAL